MNAGHRDIESRIASRVSAFTIDDVPSRVVNRAKMILLDTVGISIYGSHRSYISDVIRTSEQYGYGSFIADGRGATSFATWEHHAPLLAAEANSTAASSTEYYEGLQGAGMAGIHVVPAVLAVAEHIGANGKTTLEAIVVGYEVAGVVGELLRPLRDDLHGHGGNHPVGVAAAVGHLLDLTEEEFANALRIAANPLVVGHWGAILDGATVRNYYSGRCVTHGIQAAILADSAIDGMEHAIAQTLFRTLSVDPPTADAIEAGCTRLLSQWYLTENIFKMSPTCRYTHAPLEGLTAIQTNEQLDISAIESITVYTSEFATYGDIHQPTSEVDAKYSIPYVLAVYLHRGDVDVACFGEDSLRDPDLIKLADRVDVAFDSKYEALVSDGKWGAAVEVTTHDGEVFRADVEDAESGVDVRLDDIVDKFNSLLMRCDVTVNSSRLRRECLHIEEVADIRSLFQS